MHTDLYLDWSEKAAINAEQLAQEARFLSDAKRSARAYYLAHMAIEESAKSILLWAMGPTMLGDELPRLSALLRNHKKKIEFVVSYAASASPELAAQLGELQPKLISHINDLKNETMYVSVEDAQVIMPSDRVAKIDVSQHLSVAEGLADMARKLLTNASTRRAKSHARDA